MPSVVTPLHETAPAQARVQMETPSLTACIRCSDLDVYICHTHKYLCLGGVADSTLREIQHHGREAINNMARAKQPVSHQAFLSFGIITLATRNKFTHILNVGYEMYSRAARGLNEALSHPDSSTCLGDEVVLAVTTLAFLELIVPSEPAAYSQHTQGLEKIMELRGAEREQSVNMSQLYRLARTLVISSSLRGGRRAGLRSRAWKEAFRMHCTEKEEREQDLLDALADCTVLLAATSRGQKSGTLLAAMNGIIWSVLYHLDSFRQRFGCVSILKSMPSYQCGSAIGALQALWESGLPMSGGGSRTNKQPEVYLAMLYYLVFVHVFRALGKCLANVRFAEHVPTLPLLDLALLDDVPQQDSDNGFQHAQRLAALQICSLIPKYQSEKKQYKSGSSPFAVWAMATAFMTLGGASSTAGRRIRDAVNTQDSAIRAQPL